MTTPATTASVARSDGLVRARRDDSAHRRQAVLRALHAAAATGETISVSGIARAARVHRTFLYRHPDLHAAVLAQAAAPTNSTGERAPAARPCWPTWSTSSSATLAWPPPSPRWSAGSPRSWATPPGGSPASARHSDVDALQRKITELEQTIVELRADLSERDDELDAARAANRELMTRLNTPSRS